MAPQNRVVSGLSLPSAVTEQARVHGKGKSVIDPCERRGRGVGVEWARTQGVQGTWWDTEGASGIAPVPGARARFEYSYAAK